MPQRNLLHDLVTRDHLDTHSANACFRWWRALTVQQRRTLADEYETGHVVELWIATLDRMRARRGGADE